MRNFYATALLMGVFLVGCSNTRDEAREAAKETGEASREVGAAANRDRIEYQRRMEARLDEMDRNIDAMKEKSKNATGAAKAKWDREVAELEDERREARAKYNEMKNSADASWESFKDGVETAANKVEAGYNRVLEKMKTDR
jgi:hypothetical protein